MHTHLKCICGRVHSCNHLPLANFEKDSGLMVARCVCGVDLDYAEEHKQCRFCGEIVPFETFCSCKDHRVATIGWTLSEEELERLGFDTVGKAECLRYSTDGFFVLSGEKFSDSESDDILLQLRKGMYL